MRIPLQLFEQAVPVGVPGRVREPVPLLSVPLVEALAVGEAVPLHADHADTLANPVGPMPSQHREALRHHKALGDGR